MKLVLELIITGVFGTIIGDFDFCIRLSKQWKILSIQEPIAFNRLHDNNESIRNYKMQTDELKIWFSTTYPALLVNENKISGILIKTHTDNHESIINLGIGLNVNTSSHDYKNSHFSATSLKIENKSPLDLKLVFY